MKLKVTIRTGVTNSNLDNTREAFWRTLIRKTNSDEETPAAAGENYLLRQFPNELKNNIISALDYKIRRIEDHVFDRDYYRLIGELRLRKPNIEKSENLNEYYRTIATAIKENAELRETLFSNNDEYRQLLEKRILASQFVFSVSNFKYASLAFDLNIEPAQKVIDFFDNNFEYMQVFLSVYIGDIFNEKFNDNNSRVINYTVSRDNNSQTRIIQSMSNPVNSNDADEKGKSKLDKAKWYWSVANGSLLFPVLISIYLIYNYSDKLDKVTEIQNQKLNTIFERQDHLINHYQDEVKRLKDIELRLLTVSKKDSTATKTNTITKKKD